MLEKICFKGAVSAGCLLMVPWISFTPVKAQPVLDHYLSGVRVAEHNGCAVVKVDFNAGMQYSGHFPKSHSDQIRIRLKPVGSDLSEKRKIPGGRESLPAPISKRAAIHAMDLELVGEGATLNIYFKHMVSFKVSQGKAITSLLIAVGDNSRSKLCEPVFVRAGAILPGEGKPSPSSDGKKEVATTGPATVAKASETLEERDKKRIADARAALTAKKPTRAVRLLTSIAGRPAGKHHREAQELLGVARERNKQFPHAKAEYKEYLRKYPTGAGAKRVRQRLAVLETIQEEVSRKLRKANAKPVVKRRFATNQRNNQDNTNTGGPGQPPIPVGSGVESFEKAPVGRTERILLAEKKRDDEWKIEYNGSLSTYYSRNAGISQFRRLTNLEKEYNVYQDTLVSSTYMDVEFRNPRFKGKLRFSGLNQKEYTDGQVDNSVSQAYIELKDKKTGLFGKLGRQTRFTDGVLGRYDGGSLGWEFRPDTSLSLVLGSPVDSSKDDPFIKNRYFWGTSLAFPILDDRMKGSVYYIDQRYDNLVDRRSIGMELYYSDKDKNGYGVVDYDVHFNAINSAVLSGGWHIDDDTQISMTVDYRKSPLLFTSNAIQGQSVLTLNDLRNIYSLADIERLAFDRSADSFTGAIGISRDLGSHLQWNNDVSISKLNSTQASGGVDATPATGWDYSIMTQLVASSLFREGDIFTSSYRFSKTDSYNYNQLEFRTRIPVTKNLRIGPRVRLSQKNYKNSDRIEYQFVPSVRTNYRLGKNVRFEFDVGAKWTNRYRDIGLEKDVEFLATAGIRYDFGFYD